jgi:hypothetical protein
VYITGEKQDKVLDGMASYIAATTHLKGMTGPDLFAKGLRTVEESRPMAPGERMRHAFVWWPGRMEEPLRCAQYIFAAKNLLDIPKAREVGSGRWSLMLQEEDVNGGGGGVIRSFHKSASFL